MRPGWGEIGVGQTDENEDAEHSHVEAEGGLLAVPGGGLPHGEPFTGHHHEAEEPDEKPE